MYRCVVDTSFTPGLSLAGGIFIGVSSGLMLLSTGKIAGLSGIFGSILSLEPLKRKDAGDKGAPPAPAADDGSWKFAFAAGFGLTGIAAAALFPRQTDQLGFNSGWVTILVSGALVGLGTKLGNGCTSGHGVCGLARLSRRSLAAVLTFMTSAVAMASVAGSRGWLCNDRESGIGGFGAGGKWDESWPELRVVAAAVCLVMAVVPLSTAAFRRQWRQHIVAFLCGGTFATGLVLGGMGQRAKVVNFLQMGREGGWDPSLMFVLGAAVPVTHILFRIALSRGKGPLICDPGSANKGQAAFCLPTRTDVDMQLVLGAWLFGAGWGLAGLCPGPAWLLATLGHPKVAFGFVPAMALGMRAAPAAAQLCLPTQLAPCPCAKEKE